MQYCCNYFTGSLSLNHSDEIMVEYNKKNTNLIDFTQKYNDKIIVINCVKCSVEDFINSFDIFDILSNIKLYITYTQFEEAGEKLNNHRFFFPEVVSSLDRLNFLLTQGVSDMYIGNELGFKLKQIAPYLKSNNITIRVYPNIAQNMDYSHSINSFFIRPEDMSLYEDIIDVYEFWCDPQKQDVLYDIYKQGKWLGDLSQIILNLDIKINNVNIISDFGTTRLGCGKKCVYGDCHLCDIITNFSNTTSALGVKIEEVD